MGTQTVERRHGRRLALQAPLAVRRIEGKDAEEMVTANVSLGGLYFETDRPYQPQEAVIISVGVPESNRRDFPFSRLAGRSHVVRVDDLSPQEGRKRYGIALAFAESLTTLFAVPPRS